MPVQTAIIGHENMALINIRLPSTGLDTFRVDYPRNWEVPYGRCISPRSCGSSEKTGRTTTAVSETKKLINMLHKSMGQAEPFADPSESSGIIRPDQFYGKQFATAASEYLEMRKQACQPDEILKGLAEGGFDFDVMGWRETDRLRSLSISLAKNNVKFHRLKNGSFGLRSWYDEDFLKRSA